MEKTDQEALKGCINSAGSTALAVLFITKSMPSAVIGAGIGCVYGALIGQSTDSVLFGDDGYLPSPQTPAAQPRPCIKSESVTK